MTKTSKPLVLFDATPMALSNKSGIGNYTELLVTSLAGQYGDQIELRGYYFDFLGRKHIQPPSINGVQYSVVKWLPGKLLNIGRLTKFMLPLECFLPGIKPDFVLWMNYVGMPVMRRVPSSAVIYDMGFLDVPEFVQEKNRVFLTKQVPQTVRRSSFVITISEYSKARLMHYFPQLGNIVTTAIPPRDIQLPDAADQEAHLTEFGLERSRYYLYIGTLEPRKNIVTLLDAYSQLPEKVRHEYALVLAGGKGWKDDEILTKIERYRSDGLRIIQPGYITDEQKAALYNNCAAFILPSHYEGFGMPILEALSYGAKTIVSDIPVFREVGGGAVSYFDKDSAADLAHAMIDVLEDKVPIDQHAIDQALHSTTWQRNAEFVYTAMVQSIKQGDGR